MTQPLFLIFDGEMPSKFSFEKFYKSPACDSANLDDEGDYLYLDKAWISTLNSKPMSLFGAYDVCSLDSTIELLHMRSTSKTMEKKILSLPQGKSTSLFRSSITSHIIAYRLSDSDIDFMEKIALVNKELANVNKMIDAAIPHALLEKKKELEKQKRAFKK